MGDAATMNIGGLYNRAAQSRASQVEIQEAFDSFLQSKKNNSTGAVTKPGTVTDFFEPEVKASLGSRIKKTLTDQTGSVKNPLGGKETDLQRLGRLRESSANLNRMTPKALDQIEGYIDHVEGISVKTGDEAINLKADAQLIAETIGAKATGGDKSLANELRDVLDRKLADRKKAKSATTQTTLLEEAKGFKTADEFVRKPRGNEDTLYHYTNANVGDTLKPRPNVELAEMNYLGDGVYVTNQKNGYEGKNELMAFPSKDLDILDLTTAVAEEKFLEQISKEIGTPVARSGGGLYDDLRLMASNIGENHQRVKDAVSKVSKGKDGIKANFAQYTNDDNFYELVLNEKVDVKTKAQLTDIWKQANQ
jgi:hypothetical protein